MFNRISMKIVNIFVLLFLLSLFFNSSFAASDVKPGDTITFKIRNSDNSAGHMEGVSVSIESQPSFVSLEGTLPFPSTISPKDSEELKFRIQCVNQSTTGTLRIKVTHNMQTAGFGCTPEEWKKTVKLSVSDCNDKDPCTIDHCDLSKGGCWYEKNTNNPECDTDNSDPTFIQRPRGGDSPSTYETPYQFSPTSSPDVQDTLEIDYNVTHTSQVSILIYDYDGTLVRTLMNSEIRNAGDIIDIWDGRDNSEELVPDGIYRFIISGVNIENTLDEWSITGEIIIDNTAPIANIEFIKADTPQFGYYTAVGTVSDSHFDAYCLDIYNDDVDITTTYNHFSITDGELGVINASELEEGIYTIRITAMDFAGNVSVAERPLVIRHSTNALKIHINSITKTANLATNEKSGTICVDTTPPSFGDWIIPEIYTFTEGPQSISVQVADYTSINTPANRLQYGIASSGNNSVPDIIGCTDFGNGSNGTLDLSWSNYDGMYLYIRCYAEDTHGNMIYSDVRKHFIQTVIARPTTVQLQKGFNLIAIPEDVTHLPDLKDWLPVLGDISEIEKVFVYDDQAEEFVTLIPGSATNPSFMLQGGEGLIVYAKQDKEITFATLLSSARDLKQGFNLVGFACPVDGYTAFQLLSDLGSENVASILRYSTNKGAFETAGFGPAGQVVGVDFVIVPGEGYFIYMK